MKIDVVIVSDAKDNYLRNLTERAIDTCGNHNIIVVESNKEVKYKNAKTIHPTQQFNYNLYLNIGANLGKEEYIFFGNNDIIFHKNWDIEIIKAMKKYNIQSASPFCPESHPRCGITQDLKIIKGLTCQVHFCGWAYVWERRLYEELGGFEEYFTFWCSDDSTIELLKKYRKEHMLVTSSMVTHIGKGSNTLKTLDRNTFYKYTYDEFDKYKIRYSEIHPLILLYKKKLYVIH